LLVAGLNPHSGEAGIFGNEEKLEIAPAVEDVRGMGIPVSGPYPADALFHKAYKGEFDIVVCMYHDQGLIPLKMIAFDKGVNMTVGLPFVRTSPDHGTAYDIAWKGIADPSSLIEAIKTRCLTRRQITIMKLFDPISFAGVSLKNRMVRSATYEKRADVDGFVTDSLIDLYKDLTQGGVGLIITGNALVHPSGRSVPQAICIHNDHYIDRLRDLTDAVHRLSGTISIQLSHGGRQCFPSLLGGAQPMGAFCGIRPFDKDHSTGNGRR